MGRPHRSLGGHLPKPNLRPALGGMGMVAMAPTRVGSGDNPPRLAHGASCTSGGAVPRAAQDPQPMVALGPAPTPPEAEATVQTHVVHPVDSRAKEKQRIDADALDAVASEVIGIQRLLFGLLEERESAGQHGYRGGAGSGGGWAQLCVTPSANVFPRPLGRHSVRGERAEPDSLPGRGPSPARAPALPTEFGGAAELPQPKPPPCSSPRGAGMI